MKVCGQKLVTFCAHTHAAQLVVRITLTRVDDDADDDDDMAVKYGMNTLVLRTSFHNVIDRNHVTSFSCHLPWQRLKGQIEQTVAAASTLGSIVRIKPG